MGVQGAGLQQGPRQAWSANDAQVGGGARGAGGGAGGPWNRTDESRQGGGGGPPKQAASSFSAGDARSGLSHLPGAGDAKANFGRGLARTPWQGLDGDAGFEQRIEEDRAAFAAEFGNKFHAAGINFDKYGDIQVRAAADAVCAACCRSSVRTLTSKPARMWVCFCGHVSSRLRPAAGTYLPLRSPSTS